MHGIGRRVAAGVLLALPACGPAPLEREHVESLFSLDPRRLHPAPASAAMRSLGAALFTAARDGVSCAGCHPPDRLGTDRQRHGRDTPPLADVSHQLLFGWDGAHSDLAAMIASELRTRLGIADDAAAAAWIGADAELLPLHAAAVLDGEPTVAGLAAALAAHLDTWRTTGAWDRFVEGDDAALPVDAQRGLATFVSAGCAACHADRTLGGRSRHRLGASIPYATEDHGLAAVTGREQDRFFFRAPMLRNAAATGPWLHDGSIGDLPTVVRLMARHELGTDLEDEQVASIVTFLCACAAPPR